MHSRSCKPLWKRKKMPACDLQCRLKFYKSSEHSCWQQIKAPKQRSLSNSYCCHRELKHCTSACVSCTMLMKRDNVGFSSTHTTIASAVFSLCYADVISAHTLASKTISPLLARFVAASHGYGEQLHIPIVTQCLLVSFDPVTTVHVKIHYSVPLVSHSFALFYSLNKGNPKIVHAWEMSATAKSMRTFVLDQLTSACLNLLQMWHSFGLSFVP